MSLSSSKQDIFTTIGAYTSLKQEIGGQFFDPGKIEHMVLQGKNRSMGDCCSFLMESATPGLYVTIMTRATGRHSSAAMAEILSSELALKSLLNPDSSS